MKQNNPCYLFGMYESNTVSIIVSAINDTYTGTPLTISCEKCNSADIDTRYHQVYRARRLNYIFRN